MLFREVSSKLGTLPPLTLLARLFRSTETVRSSSMTLLLLLDLPHAILEDGIAPLLRLVSTFENWGGSSAIV
jgi:hypothetical protein